MRTACLSIFFLCILPWGIFSQSTDEVYTLKTLHDINREIIDGTTKTSDPASLGVNILTKPQQNRALVTYEDRVEPLTPLDKLVIENCFKQNETKYRFLFKITVSEKEHTYQIPISSDLIKHLRGQVEKGDPIYIYLDTIGTVGSTVVSLMTYYELAQEKPYDPQVRIYIDDANQLAGQGKYEEALELYNKAADKGGNFAGLYAYRGQLNELLEHYEDAFNDYEKSIGLDENFFLPYMYRGKLLIRYEKFDAANSDFLQCIKSDPSDAEFYVFAAITYAAQGDTQNALDYIEKSFHYGNIDEQWLKQIPYLKKVRKTRRYRKLIKNKDSIGQYFDMADVLDYMKNK